MKTYKKILIKSVAAGLLLTLCITPSISTASTLMFEYFMLSRDEIIANNASHIVLNTSDINSYANCALMEVNNTYGRLSLSLTKALYKNGDKYPSLTLKRLYATKVDDGVSKERDLGHIQCSSYNGQENDAYTIALIGGYLMRDYFVAQSYSTINDKFNDHNLIEPGQISDGDPCVYNIGDRGTYDPKTGQTCKSLDDINKTFFAKSNTSDRTYKLENGDFIFNGNRTYIHEYIKPTKIEIYSDSIGTRQIMGDITIDWTNSPLAISKN